MLSSAFIMRTSQVLLLLSGGIAAVTGRSAKPNFVFIITDDQDLHLNSLAYQPSVQKHFAEEGTWLKKHYCTIAICCPSRVSFLTGKAAHNTNVTDVVAPYGTFETKLKIYEMDADHAQADILGSLKRGSMITIFQCGFRMLGIIPITRGR
jgi:hypothetical protein